MTDNDSIQLTRAIEDLARAVREGSEGITNALTEIDATIQSRLEDVEPVKVTELVDKLSSLGARAVMNVVENWQRNWEHKING